MTPSGTRVRCQAQVQANFWGCEGFLPEFAQTSPISFGRLCLLIFSDHEDLFLVWPPKKGLRVFFCKRWAPFLPGFLGISPRFATIFSESKLFWVRFHLRLQHHWCKAKKRGVGRGGNESRDFGLLRFRLTKSDVVDLTVVGDEVRLDPFPDVLGEIVEVALIIAREDQARHSRPFRLCKKRPRFERRNTQKTNFEKKTNKAGIKKTLEFQNNTEDVEHQSQSSAYSNRSSRSN